MNQRTDNGGNSQMNLLSHNNDSVAITVPSPGSFGIDLKGTAICDFPKLDVRLPLSTLIYVPI